MAAGKGTTYVVHYQSGERSEPLEAAEVRQEITAGRVGVDERISRDGGPAVEYYHYDEFVDLWDVDDSFDFLYGSDSAAPGPSEDTKRTRLEPGGAMFPPSPFLPSDAPPSETPADAVPAVRVDLNDRAESTQQVVNPLAAGGAEWGDGVESTQPEGAHEQGWDDELEWDDFDFDQDDKYTGYDPVPDLILDAVTIRDLLRDSSLYTVLRVDVTADAEALRQAYLTRREQLAMRQRQLGRTDPTQVEALEAIRRLIYSAYVALGDPHRRVEYEQAGSPAAAAFLDLMPAAAQAQPPEPAEALHRADVSTEQPAEAGDESPLFEPGFFEEELDARQTTGSSRLVDWSQSGSPTPAESASVEAGPRVYANISADLDRLSSGTLEPVGEIFEGRAPSADRERARRAAERAPTAGRQRARTKAFVAGPSFSPGLAWSQEDEPGKALAQVVPLVVAAFVISLMVVLATDYGLTETYGSLSPWLFGRAALLVGLTLIGTLAVRREPMTRVGLFPDPMDSIVGLGFGVVLGLMGSRVAPIYVAEGAGLVPVLASMLFVALGHELFFRGYVTRTLLVGMGSPIQAVVISCLIYGAYHLSYYNVLQSQGFYLFYYSVLLYGFGLGSVYAFLYWRSHSIWPSFLAHSAVLALAMLLAP